jgi:hypothetical protein
MMERPNFVRKSMPSNGVATTANKKSTQNFVLRNRQKFGESFAVVSHQVCRPVGSSVEACGKIDSDAPETIKKQKLFCVS